jgi:bifunctional DNA-binding transcriptional regulator/antitoxin component of YhaV-PrlF toxin-antitoxin module
MSATAIREDRQATLPAEVVEAAGIQPGDKVDWRFEDGEIRGRKLAEYRTDVLGLDDVDPATLLPKRGAITTESITAAVRADREGRSV